MTAHVPVLANEIVEALQLRPGDIAIDGTVGGGGHTELLARRVAPDGLVIGVDRDVRAIEQCQARLSGLPIKLLTANFCDLPEILRELNIAFVQAVILDLGLSSDQLADDQRGFSFASEGPLDLRFDTTRGAPAWKLLQRISEKHLADLIFRWGEERFSRRIARHLVRIRKTHPIRTSQELATQVRKVVPRSKNHSIDPATRTFQALRIAVNDELKWVEVALRRLPELLQPAGRMAVISFHSLEDRLVKNAFRDHPLLQVETKKPIRPAESEVLENPRCRSAKLRIASRVAMPTLRQPRETENRV